MNGEISALQLRELAKCFERLADDALDLTVHAGKFYARVWKKAAGPAQKLLSYPP